MLKSLYTSEISTMQTGEVFCLYGDITNFSKIAKFCPTENVSVKIMKEFYEQCLKILNEKEGLVLNFPGDGFLCVWNKSCDAEKVKSAIHSITSIVNKLMCEWKGRIIGDDIPKVGIKYGAILADVTFFVSEDNRILNTFGNELTIGARLQQAKENKNNYICISPNALKWLSVNKNSLDLKEMLIEVKGDKAKAYILPVFDIN